MMVSRKEAPVPEEKKERPKRLTAQRKYQIYLETRGPDAPIGEILRHYGIHLNDLRKIEETVESASIAALKTRSGKRAMKRDVTPEEYDQVIKELREKEKALADLAVEYQLFKKKEALELERERKRKSSQSR
jgi:hypothetical protein